MSLSPTTRGLRLIRATLAPSITVPPPGIGGPETLLVTDTNQPIATETGARLITETA